MSQFNYFTTSILSLQDVNDNTPAFEDSVYPLSILEDLSEYEVNETILTVQAIDQDLSSNFGNASLRFVC